MDTKWKEPYVNKFHQDMMFSMKDFINTFMLDQKSETKRAMNILLVEDDISDIDKFKTEMDKTNIPYNIIALSDYASAISYLKREKPYSEMPVPDMIMINICSEKVHGHRLVEFIRSVDVLREIPICTSFNFGLYQKPTSEGIRNFCEMKKPFTSRKIVDQFREIKTIWSLFGTSVNNLSVG